MVHFFLPFLSCYLSNFLFDVPPQDRCGEFLPIKESSDQEPRKPKDGVYHVFTDVVEVKKFLTHPKFVLVESESEADILWIRENLKDFR